MLDTLLRSNPTAKPDTADLGSVRHEIARILTIGLRDGDVAAPDRTYVAQVVAARTGLSQADADTRVSNVINQAKTDLDNARKAAAKLSLWLTASLLIGAFSASLAATDGGLSGIGMRVLPNSNCKPNIGGSHGSWNSAVAVGRFHSDHHSSRPLAALDRRGVLSKSRYCAASLSWPPGLPCLESSNRSRV